MSLTTHVFSQELALDAVQTVALDIGAGQKEIDIKNYAKVEKLPGGTIEDCRVLKVGAQWKIVGWSVAEVTILRASCSTRTSSCRAA